MSIVTNIVETFLSAITALFGGVGEGIISLFETLIYNPTTGLTALAQWGLVFIGFGFVISILHMILRRFT